MAGKKKREWAAASDRIAVYGYPPGFAYTYDAEIGLDLNVGRQEERRAWAFANGAALAGGGGRVSEAWAAALASSDEEAGELHFKINAARDEARAYAKIEAMKRR